MKSIKTRLAVNFMFIIVITVVILELLLIYSVRQNNYNNLEAYMLEQVKVSAELYEKYFSDSTLEDNVLNNVDTFWRQSSAQVQIIDISGKTLMDSIGVISTAKDVSPDVTSALKGKKGIWIGSVDYDKNGVMALSYPLKSNGETVGVIRFITSLREVNRETWGTAVIFIVIGIIVIFISGFLSIFLSNSIINPLREVTEAAEKMASGNYKIHSVKKYEDEIGKLSDTLNYMADEIVKREQIKNDFISSVSHELRTPLTSIKGWAVTLQNEKFQDSKNLSDGLGIIEKESDRLTEMVEELLDFSRFVTGKITIKQERVDIPMVMEHIKMQLMPRAQREGIVFAVEYDGSITDIISDENRLKQLFINLLDNAFNFTQPGGRVDFRAGYIGNGIAFHVTDNGSGISSEDLPRIKEKFYKGKSSKSKNGIGLSICDEIVKLMGGTMMIESEIGSGTRVCIVLPSKEEGK